MHLSTGEAPIGAEGGASPATPPEAIDQPIGVAPPRSIAEKSTEFSDFGLDPTVLRAVTELGYRHPTPIQAQAIPVVMSGRDVMGAAQTGTGKTAGFALPIIHSLLPLASSSTSPARHPTRALIIAPTRELADQIYENVKAYAQYTPLRCTAVFGGMDMKPQTAALRQGVEILIATPGRLLDHVEQKTVNLSQVQMLVLDEADRMLDMGFLPDIQRIINLLASKRQSLMFSATFSDEIRRLARTFLDKPVLIEVARRNALADSVEQTVYRVESDEAKRAAVAHLIRTRNIEQVIVFSNTKLGAGRLARQLQKEGLNAEAIHGDKSQQERLQTLEAFKQGGIKVLVATDVAARGLDIVELPAVINFDLPHSPEDYIHRIGRTGRAGATGMALSIMMDKDQRYLADIEKLIQLKIRVEALDPGMPRRTDAAVRPEGGFAAPREAARDIGREPGRESSREESRDGSRSSGRDKTPRDAVARREAAPRRDPSTDRERQARRGGSSSGPGRDGKMDPFFSRPYEPASDSLEVEAPASQEALHGPGGRRPVGKVAALLGGKPSQQ
ncbi:MAG: DEAD/DEAH box helicase [Lautropia sp.]|nr:DEAD/DEAH box helicase [Lautropia sp.]